MLFFGVNSVPLNDVVVIMSALEGRLHAGKLVLHAV
jgi:hypothetical protein